MKKNLITTACFAAALSLTVFSAKADVNQKVLKSFHSVFSKANNIIWSEYSDHYFVSFTQDDMQVKANYDMSGNIINSIRYYKEQRLPLNILYSVKKSYPSETIDIVTEVSDANEMAFFIQLRDSKGWTIVKSDEEGQLEVTDKFQKTL